MYMLDWKTIVAAASGIVAIAGAVTVISKVLKPYKDFKKQTRECEKRFQNDKKALEELKNDMRETLKAVCVLLEHAATGNSVEKCKNKRDELIEYVANK